MESGLKGRVAIVTGGSRGIGQAVASALAAEGAQVVICGRDVASCEDAAAALGERVTSIPADVTDDDAVRDLVAETVRLFGGIDAIVNNAGSFGGGPVVEITDRAVLEGIDVKPLGALRLSRWALPHLRDSDQARIVNVAGASAEKVVIGASMTGMANAGMLALNAYLARELVSDGICVNAVVPGFVRTGVWEERLRAIAEAEDINVEEAATLVLERGGIGHARWGAPDDVAAVIAFLLSAAGSFVSGTAIRVDGGQSSAVAY